MGISRRKFTKELKLAAIQRLEQGSSAAEVARAFEINPNLLRLSYRSGENTVITCNLPESGYLQIFSYGVGDPNPILVFPNAKHNRNSVARGSIDIPTDAGR